MNYIFANVDKTKVPYGILRDYGMEFTNIENYKGTVTFSALVGVLCGGFFSLASPTTALSHPMRKKAKLIHSGFIKFS